MEIQHGHKPDTPAQTNEDATCLNRRQALGRILAGAMTTYAAMAIPSEARSGEPERTSEFFRLRDLDRVYELWKKQHTSTFIPPIEVFRDAVMTCREAACSIFLMRGPLVSAVHSGFVVSIPEEYQTPSSRGKSYVVTCDHARLDHGGTRPIIQLPNGTTIAPQFEIITKLGQRGIPVKDLRIYECPAGSFATVRALPLRLTEAQPPNDAPAMTYEPLNLRARQIIDERKQTVVLEPHLQTKPVIEKFVLTRVSHPSDFPFDPSYPESSGFNTAGQLKVGGSGSPVIIFTERDFYVAGHQVSYGDRHDIEDESRIDGEINNDGNVVHINNAIQLLREKGRWK